MKTFKCTRLRLCNYLMDRGFFPYRVEPDPGNPRYKIYLFEESPALTAAVVVCVGLLGGILGFKTMKLTHIGSPMAQGLSLGAAAHAVGTSTAMDISSKYGAFASLGLTLNGIFTALLTPTILRLLGLL